MSKIPKELLERMNVDPFYMRCCITGTMSERIERHHVIIYAGKQLQAYWAIVPVAKSIHDQAEKPEIKRKIMHVALNRATEEELRSISKAFNYIRYRNELNKIYGPWLSTARPGDVPAGATMSL